MFLITLLITIIVFYFNPSARRVLINFLNKLLTILEAENKNLKTDKSDSLGKDKVTSLIVQVFNKIPVSFGYIFIYIIFAYGMGEILGNFGVWLFGSTYFYILPFGAFVTAAIPGVIYKEIQEKIKSKPNGNIFITALVATASFYYFWQWGWVQQATVLEYENMSETLFFYGRFSSFTNIIETIGFFLGALIFYGVAQEESEKKDKSNKESKED